MVREWLCVHVDKHVGVQAYWGEAEVVWAARRQELWTCSPSSRGRKQPDHIDCCPRHIHA